MAIFLSFFFQAEDGIRDIGVTGVQTCALPICGRNAKDGLPPVRGESEEIGTAVGRDAVVEVQGRAFRAAVMEPDDGARRGRPQPGSYDPGGASRVRR